MPADSQFAPMVLIGAGTESSLLKPVRFQATKGAGVYDEAWLQNLLFAHPEAIPVDEVDASFGPLVPICMELDTREAGFIDALFANSLGLLTIAEFKLWRNPEARREVIGQILDYARVLRRWSYADLKREISRVLKKPGENSLFDLVKGRHPDLDEARLIDNVSRNLRQGRFLLLTIGDGIREGVESIAGYVQDHAGLHFTFGLIEAPVYELDQGRRIVQPRVLARTAIVNRSVVELKSDELRVAEEEEQAEEETPSEPTELEIQYEAFWTELLRTLKLDDVTQPLPRPRRGENIYFMLPPKRMWISAFFSRTTSSIGVFVGWDRTSSVAREICNRLEQERDAIDREIGMPVDWTKDKSGKLTILARKVYPSLLAPTNRQDQLAWFQDTINRFVGVFRPRITTLWNELSSSGS